MLTEPGACWSTSEAVATWSRERIFEQFFIGALLLLIYYTTNKSTCSEADAVRIGYTQGEKGYGVVCREFSANRSATSANTVVE